MNNKIKHFIIIGSSRGLGASLVNELLESSDYQVVGVARTPLINIECGEDWMATPRYKHIELDISSYNACKILKESCSDLQDKPLCVIFNAAYIKNDTNKNGLINYEALKETNATGINGLCNVLEAFEEYLIKNNGMFVGISSFSVFAPPVLNSKVSYPATKSYLDTLLNSLRVLWGNKAKVITIHLGYLRRKKQESILSELLAPSYLSTARKIISSITANNTLVEVNYPFIYTFTYKYILRFTPRWLSLFLVSYAAKILGGRIPQQEKLK